MYIYQESVISRQLLQCSAACITIRLLNASHVAEMDGNHQFYCVFLYILNVVLCNGFHYNGTSLTDRWIQLNDHMILLSRKTFGYTCDSVTPIRIDKSISEPVFIICNL